MKMKKQYLLLLLIVVACKQSPTVNFPSPTHPNVQEKTSLAITREEYYDKVLGMLVGSAIGDAMGAPTEMWDRKRIEIQKGYIDSLDAVTREASPEGPWETNLPAGSSTDDTRWKYLGTQFLMTQTADTLNASDFANHIIHTYENEIDKFRKEEPSYKSIEKTYSHLSWLIEWVQVAKPFVEMDLVKYNDQLSRFYGGEMSCAGMLYSPLIGAYYPGMPMKGYQQAFGLSIFDIGYARDITALTAAYVSKAMELDVKYSDITLITRDIDPQHYFKSRLIGRLAYQAFETANAISHESYLLNEKDIPINLQLPKNFKHGALYYIQQKKAYSLLETHLQDIPFHAGEIHLINLTALAFSKGDFMKAMEFVINFGRDNDTVAAVTGSILGAYWGYKQLPKQMALQIVTTHKTTIGIDLEEMARKLVDHRFGDTPH